MSQKLLEFVAEMTRLVQSPPADEAQTLTQAQALMQGLVREDDWLPEAMAQSHPVYYQQHLLYGDPLDRFSLVSFVWGPGQATPLHAHLVGGVSGMLRGAECPQSYQRDAQGHLQADGPELTLRPGDTACVSPRIGDIHQVRNALADQVSISIHLYGGNIGRIQRHVFNPGQALVKDFVSGYSNAMSPNLWAREPA